MKQKIDIIKGDKVVILQGEYQKKQGIIKDIEGDVAEVVFAEGTAMLPIGILRNYSAAARKAWHTRPHRAAGRPRDDTLPSKRMISLRLEVRLWDELGKAVATGKIRSREAAINRWIREKLDEL